MSRIIETIWQDLRYGIRMLLKKPAFTLIAFFTLALGVSANTAIFTVVNAVLLRSLPYPESEKLMEAGRVFAGSDDVSALSEPKFVFLRDHNQSFEAVTATQGMGSNTYLSDETQTEYISGLMVSADFLAPLPVVFNRNTKNHTRARDLSWSRCRNKLLDRSNRFCWFCWLQSDLCC